MCPNHLIAWCCDALARVNIFLKYKEKWYLKLLYVFFSAWACDWRLVSKQIKISEICVYDVNFMTLWHFFLSILPIHTHNILSFFYEFYDIDNFIGAGTFFPILHTFLWYSMYLNTIYINDDLDVFVLHMFIFFISNILWLYKWQNCSPVSVHVCLMNSILCLKFYFNFHF